MTRRIAWLPVLVALASCSHASPAPVFPKLPHELFDTPIEITGAFGDHRNTHFHAGLDLATGGVVGRAVHAPIDADVVRVRASGVGYGRSLYLDTADGRTLVFGHLDAFAEPVASYVAAVQDSSGQYEQDLWPAHGRFRVHAGDVIGWTGRSGTGTPHLHVEVRRGDMAINPLLAGYAVADTTTPHIESVALYGVDDILTHADVEFGARDTVRAAVRSRAFRVFVKALDAGRSGRYDIAPWRVRVGLGPEWVQCEFDSVSWATDMAQSDFVYQAGADVMRVGGADGFRPVVVSGSSGSASGVWSVPAGQDAMLSIEAEDLAGHVTRRWVHLHGEPATRDVGPPGTLVTRESGASVELPGIAAIEIPRGAVFESVRVGIADARRVTAPVELVPVGTPVQAPVGLPLEKPVRVRMNVSRAVGRARLGMFRRTSDSWDWIGDDYDAVAHTLSGNTRRLGTFALYRDTRAPRVTMLAPAPRVPASPYSRWALEVRLDEQGSGVDARATYFTVDGRIVPSEWDDVVSTLRWKPLAPPAPGSHRFSVIAADRAGNTRKMDGRFMVK